MATSVPQDVVGFDITKRKLGLAHPLETRGLESLPMDESQSVYCLDRQNELSHIETSDILREDFVLDEHGHKIAAWQELHEQVQADVVLESGVKLDDLRAVCLRQDVPLGANMSQLPVL